MSADLDAGARAARLIAEMDALALRRDGYGHFAHARSLGEIGRGRPEVVSAMIERLGHEDARIQKAALSVFCYLGDDVCNREREIAGLIFPLLDRLGTGAYAAYASVGRHLPEVRRWIIEQAKDRPPKWRRLERFPDYTFDAVMQERGTAISAMRYLFDYAEECLPSLTDAMENFKEYDPDEEHQGPLGRISEVLKTFGPKAAHAAVPLARHLRDDPDEEYPTAILEALASMGKAAIAALPHLEEFRREFRKTARGGASWPSLEEGPVDKEIDLDGWLIQQLRGQSTEEVE